MQPKLKPPRSKRLKLKCDILLSNFAFNFNLRRYTVATFSDASVMSFIIHGGKPGDASLTGRACPLAPKP
jgi:hypothetical protein